MTEYAYDVSLDRFAWCWQAISTEETRYYLQGVLIEPREQGGVYMVGTDGRIMAVAIDEQGVCDEPAVIEIGEDFRKIVVPQTTYDADIDEEYTQWTLPETARLRFGPIAPDDCAVASAHLDGWRGNFETGIVHRINGVYPKWRNAVSVSSDTPAISGPVGMIDPALLARLSYRGGPVAVMPRSGIPPKPTDKRKPPSTVVLCREAPWACGFIMPCHGDPWADYSSLARELLGDEEPPLRLAVWP